MKVTRYALRDITLRLLTEACDDHHCDDMNEISPEDNSSGAVALYRDLLAEALDIMGEMSLDNLHGSIVNKIEIWVENVKDAIDLEDEEDEKLWQPADEVSDDG